MIKVALLGDVHGNLPALKAVLAHARGKEVAAFWNIGDFVGYGAFPNEVVGTLREMGALSVLGNYDQKVLRYPLKAKKWRKKKHPLKLLAFRWAYENLSKENRRYLASLPLEARIALGARKVLLTHASPVSIQEPLTPDTPRDRFHELSALAQADIVCFGHSHLPFYTWIGKTLFVNSGSVGRPDDGDPRACYAVLEEDENTISVRHYRVEYDVEEAVRAIREQGLPEPFALMTRLGYDLNSVLRMLQSTERS